MAEDRTAPDIELIKTLAFDISLTANCIADASGTVVHVNRAFILTWGLSDEKDALGQPIEAFLHERSQAASTRELLDRDGFWRGEYSARRRSGPPFKAYGIATVVSDPEGRKIGYHVTVQDITERRLMEEAQRESEERFRIMFESAPDAIFIAHPQTGKIIDANRAACRLLGRTREEIIGIGQAELHPARTREQAREIFYLHLGQAQNYGYAPPSEIPVVRKDGKEVPVEILAQTMRFNRQTVLMGTFRDISDRKQAEEKLRSREEMIRNINNNLVSGMVYQLLRLPDGSRKFTYLSDSVVRMYGVTAEKAKQDPGLIYGRVLEEDRAEVERLEEEANSRMSVFKAELRIKNPDGTVRLSSFVSNPSRLEDGTTRWDGIELDVTDWKMAERKLAENERKAKAMLEAIPDMMFRMDADGTFLDFKAEKGDMYYREDASLIGKKVMEVLPPPLAAETMVHIGNALSTGQLQAYEYELLMHEKGVRRYEARMVPSGEKEVTAIVRDITDRNKG